MWQCLCPCWKRMTSSSLPPLPTPDEKILHVIQLSDTPVSLIEVLPEPVVPVPPPIDPELVSDEDYEKV